MLLFIIITMGGYAAGVITLSLEVEKFKLLPRMSCKISARWVAIITANIYPCSLCCWQSSKYFIYINSVTSYSKPGGKHFYSHMKDEETGSERLRDLQGHIASQR